MAERGVDPKEEKKSYGSVFVIGASLLVMLTLWAYWDDNISRRPWKGIQSHFYRLDYNKAKAAYNEEDKKLHADEKYQELAKKLAAFQSSLTDGELGKKLKSLENEEARVTVKFQEADQRVKDVKSELEEAWYEHDHAVQQKRNPKPYLDVIAELDKKKEQLDKALEPLRARRNQLKEEIKKIQTGAKDIETELAKRLLSSVRSRRIRFPRFNRCRSRNSTVTVSINRWRASTAARLAIWRSTGPVLKKNRSHSELIRGAKFS